MAEKMTLQQFGYKESHYERPNQRWVCGRLAEGRPCHVGPDKRGRCMARAECTPIRRGDRWECTRPAGRGGKCDDGPGPDGACCKAVTPCQPVRSIRAKRGVFAFWLAAITAAAIGVILFSDARMRYIEPGRLSHAHAHIQEDMHAKSCAVCHVSGVPEEADANASLPDRWLGAAITAGPHAVTDSDNCLMCHSRSPGFADPVHVYHAHGVGHDTLTALAADNEHPRSESLRTRRVHSDGLRLACSTCHKEHQGRAHRLNHMDNESCQACHRMRFDDFANDHPSFDTYPYTRRPGIVFDHRAHRDKYYPQNAAAFACAECHEMDEHGRQMVSVNYDNACSACHHTDFKAFGTTNVAFLQLPRLDTMTLTDFARDSADNPWLGDWPDTFVKGSDGLAPFLRVLLSAEPDIAAAITAIETDKNVKLRDLRKATDAQKADTVRIAWAIKALLHDLAAKGHAELRRRIEAALGVTLTDAEFAEMVAGLPPEAVRIAAANWFPDLNTHVPIHRSGGALPDRPAVKPPTPPKPKLPDAEKLEGDALFDDTDEDPPKKQQADPDALLDDSPAAGEGDGDDLLNPDDDDDLLNGGGGDELLDDGGGGDDDLLDDGGLLDDTADKPTPKQDPLLDDDDGLLDDTGGKTSAAPTPPPTPRPPPPPPPTEQHVSAGGWYVNNRAFALNYKPSGHANRVLRAWLDVTRRGAAADHAASRAMFDALRRDAAALCVKCHSVERTAGEFTVNWRAQRHDPAVRNFTRFSHKPHLALPTLKDCDACHRPTGTLDIKEVYRSSLDPYARTAEQIGFRKVQKQDCASCHQPKLAGDSCLQCHHYHVAPPKALLHRLTPTTPADLIAHQRQ